MSIIRSRKMPEYQKGARSWKSFALLLAWSSLLLKVRRTHVGNSILRIISIKQYNMLYTLYLCNAIMVYNIITLVHWNHREKYYLKICGCDWPKEAFWEMSQKASLGKQLLKQQRIQHDGSCESLRCWLPINVIGQTSPCVVALLSGTEYGWLFHIFLQWGATCPS